MQTSLLRLVKDSTQGDEFILMLALWIKFFEAFLMGQRSIDFLALIQSYLKKRLVPYRKYVLHFNCGL